MNLRFLHIFLLLATTLTSIQARSPLVVDGAHVGYMITDLSTGNIIASHNVDDLFTPASTLKCITTASALRCLGPDFTFDTKIKAIKGYSPDSIPLSTLLIEPSGDPSIDITLCSEIARLCDTITSVIIPQCRPFISPYAMVEDTGTDYGVGWTPFIYEENRSLVNDDMTPAPFDNIINDFTIDLYASGITIFNESLSPCDTTLILSHKSEPLSNLCQTMMHRSDNLYAQSIGRALSPALDIKEALDSISSYLSTLTEPSQSYNIVDISGLSRLNLLSPRTMTCVLRDNVHNVPFISSFPRVGRHGTVKRLLKSTRLENRLALKSGSMTGVLAYAGYKVDNSGNPTHTIVVFVNNANCKQSVIKQRIEKWLLNNFM